MREKYRTQWYIVIAMLLGLHSTAYANMGISIIYFPSPAMILTLIPVIVLEAFIFTRMLRVQVKRAMVISTAGNLVTTVVGAIVIFSGLTRIPIGPSEWAQNLTPNVVKLASLIPCFFGSWLIEYFVVWRIDRGLRTKDLRKAVLWANLVSYVLLALLVLGTSGILD